jgi:phosphomannomutase
MNKVILFDVDGTITEPRKKINKEMIEILTTLSNKYLIGLVSGSNFDYIYEQVISELKDEVLNKIKIFPCNGTKRYFFENKDFICDYSVNIKDVVTKDQYKLLIEKILNNQLYLMRVYKDLPLTGNFISYRESMINWCPIGRDASEKERNQFISIDKVHHLRESMLPVLKRFFDGFKIDLQISLGGDTSFDIFPIGWDKTYVLRHFNLLSEELFFIGDRCDFGGNDFELFKEVNNIKNGNAIKTNGTENTIQILKGLI